MVQATTAAQADAEVPGDKLVDHFPVPVGQFDARSCRWFLNRRPQRCLLRLAEGGGHVFILRLTQLIVRPDSRLGVLRYKIAPKCLLSGPFGHSGVGENQVWRGRLVAIISFLHTPVSPVCSQLQRCRNPVRFPSSQTNVSLYLPLSAPGESSGDERTDFLLLTQGRVTVAATFPTNLQ